MIERWNFLSGL